MNNRNYYDSYWTDRLSSGISSPIPDQIPGFLKKYSAYGSILNQIPEKTRILDLGCGNGNVSKIYLEKGRVFGIDISGNALQQAVKNGLKVKRHDLNSFPYPFDKQTFDIIILTDVLEHLIDPLNVLKDAKRLLSQSGRVIVTVPNFARLGNRIRMLLGDPIDLLHFSKYGDEVEHLHWFSKPKLEYLIGKAGFSDFTFIPTGLQNMNFIFGLLGLYNLGKFITVVIS
jgi:methionine biosynthesis protein MetW